MNARKTLVAVVVALTLCAMMALTGCSSKSPVEKVMDYAAKNGGTGSADSSVTVTIPAGTEEKLTATITKDSIEFVISMPFEGTSSISSMTTEAKTTVTVDMKSGSGAVVQENSLSINGQTATTTGKGTIDAATYKSGDKITIDKIGSNLSADYTVSVTDRFQQYTDEGVSKSLKYFNDFLDKSGTKATLADFGFKAM